MLNEINKLKVGDNALAGIRVKESVFDRGWDFFVKTTVDAVTKKSITASNKNYSLKTGKELGSTNTGSCIICYNSSLDQSQQYNDFIKKIKLKKRLSLELEMLLSDIQNNRLTINEISSLLDKLKRS